jgi:5'-3' exonuclease
MLSFAANLKSDYMCTPVFVFDGEKLQLKAAENVKRSIARDKQLDRAMAAHAQRQMSTMAALDVDFVVPDLTNEKTPEIDAGIKVPDPETTEAFLGIMKPTRQDYENLKLVLRASGYDVCTAKFEAEALCAHLVATEDCYAALTEDTDCLAFGCPRVIFKFTSGEPEEAYLPDILKALDMSYEQFVDLCCMFGNDFIENVFKVGPQTAMKLLSKHKSWPHVYAETRQSWPLQTRESADRFHGLYDQVKTLFVMRAHEVKAHE